MPKQTLIYRVTVDDADNEDSRQYLLKLREVFQIITEDLSRWGYTADESYSTSEIFYDKSPVTVESLLTEDDLAVMEMEDDENAESTEA
jgi:hypothetical protein